jgi:DNA-binding transcriptional ArsR family regulator
MTPELDRTSALFKALGSPLRLAVVTTLDEQGPLCVHELVDRLGASQPLVSQHLRVLRGADVVRGVRRGKEIAYEIADAHVAHIVADALRHTGETPAPALRGEATA